MSICVGLLAASAMGCSDQTLVGGNRPPPPGVQPVELEPGLVIEEFEQRTARASDVLFLVDDSCSMAEEQDNLAANFHAFADVLFNTEVDYHVGVASLALWRTYLRDGRLIGEPPFIEPGTPDGATVFTDRVIAMGINGPGGCESGLWASQAALGDYMLNTWNREFYREDAMLSVIVVSDENDQASLGWCNAHEARPEPWSDWWRSLKVRDSLLNFAVIGGFDPADHVTPSGCSSPELGLAYSAPTYALASRLVDGVTHSICDPDWTPVLTELAVAAAGLNRQFNLREVPLPDDDDVDGDGRSDEPVLEVRLDRNDGSGFVLTEPLWSDDPDPLNPWDYDPGRNAVLYTLDTMPETGWVLQVSYRNSADR